MNEASLGAPDPLPGHRLTRVSAALRAVIGSEPGRTRSVLRRLYQQGSARLRFPHGGDMLEAAIINGAGGLTGGDRWNAAFALEPGAALTLTTPACERIYRSLAGSAVIATALRLEQASRLEWLPQETILFDRAALDRTLDIEMAEDASLLAIEPIIFGRAAMGETVRHLRLQDRWRVRRGGRLVYADSLAFAGPTEAWFASRAGLAGCGAIASLLLVAPGAEARLAGLRELLPELPAQAGASAWDGMLAVRLAAPGGAALRQSLVALLRLLREDAALPRLWSC
jgi:urease accessory protein